jgi:hypothetical protein
MLLHSLNRNLLPVEDTCSQGGFLGLFKDLGEVFYLARIT